MITRSTAPDSRLVRTPDCDAACWDVPWLAELRDVPADAAWPRIMSPVHPRAVGSYGTEVVAQFQARMGRPLRWWQQLAAVRILEHDEDGLLVWQEYLCTVARQSGKSWLLRELAIWRLHQGPRWGDQLVLHTGKDLGILRTVLRPAQSWAKGHGWFPVRNNLEPGISTEEHMGGSAWRIKAKDAVYGEGAGNPMVDEAWDVAGSVVDEGLLPTMVEQISPQLGIWSTAHRRATGLFLQRRRTALEQLAQPRRLLALEWSTPADVDRADSAGWRMASPHWTPQRRELIADAWARVQRGESVDPEEPDPNESFDAQWLNRWPQVHLATELDPDQVLASEDEWRACLDPGAAPAAGRPLALAVEDDLGRGAAAAAAALTADGRVVVGGWRFGTLAEAVDWCEDTAGEDPDAVLLAGASLVGAEDAPMDPELEGVDLPVEPAGVSETLAGLPLTRQLVRGGRLAHDGGPDVSRAVLSARVPPSVNGSTVLVRSLDGSTALVRCVAWAVHRAHRDRD